MFGPVAWGSNFLPELPDGFLPRRPDVLQQYGAFYVQNVLNQNTMDSVIQTYVTQEIRAQSIHGTYHIAARNGVPGHRDVHITGATPEDLSRVFMMHIVADLSLSLLQQYNTAVQRFGNLNARGK